MSFKLNVSNTVEFPVRIVLNDAGKTRVFAFTLMGKRIPQDQLLEELRREDQRIGAFLQTRLTGWRGQTLVVVDDGRDPDDYTPADFSPEALAAMLGITGTSELIFEAYLSANGVQGKEKN